MPAYFLETQFLETKLDAVFFVNRLVDIIFAVDIWLQFQRPIFDPETTTWIYSRHRIAASYLKGWFWLDSISTMPFDVVSMAMQSDEVSDLSMLRILKILKLLKLLRVLRSGKILRRLMNFLGWHYSTYTIVSQIVVVVVFIHWIACGWHLVPDIASQPGIPCNATVSWIEDLSMCEATMGSRYLASLEFSLGTLAISYGYIYPKTLAERAYAFLVMMIGGSLYAYVIGVVCQAIAVRDPATVEYYATRDLLYRYMEEHQLPISLRKRLKTYFEHCKANVRSKMYSRLTNLMTPTLQFDVAQFERKEYVMSVPWFANIPPSTQRDSFLVRSLPSSPIFFAHFLRPFSSPTIFAIRPPSSFRCPLLLSLPTPPHYITTGISRSEAPA
jgi:hypothetical protein